VDLGPCRHEPLLASRQRAADHLDDVHGKNADVLLVVGVEVRPVMWSTSLDEHPNYDAEETANLRHFRRGYPENQTDVVLPLSHPNQHIVRIRHPNGAIYLSRPR
jgi:hypothetical protein